MRFMRVNHLLCTHPIWLNILVRMLLLIPAVLWVSAPVRAQADISFIGTVDKTQLGTDDVLTLELTLSGAFRNANQPDMPQLADFYVMSSGSSSQFSIINNQMSSKVVYSYRLQPVRTGTLTIPSISIQVGRDTYATQALTVEVVAGSAPEPQPGFTPQPGATAAAPEALTDQDFYVEAEVSNAEPYVSQQIIYTFRVYQRINFTSQPSLDWPEFTGFLGYDLSPNNQYEQEIGSRQYLVTEVRRVLYPTVAGAFTLDPAILTIPGGFFSRGLQLQTNFVEGQVKSLPDGAPASFTGAVGQFSIQSWIEPKVAKVNEPINLYVRITGNGNSSTLPDPTQNVDLTQAGWRVYDPQITTDMTQSADGFHGEKEIVRLLLPTKPGELDIPAFILVYFDPEQDAYQEVATNAMTVQVAEGDAEMPVVVVGDGKQDIVVLGADIRHIKNAPPSLSTIRQKVTSSVWYWLGWFIPLGAVMAAFLWRRRRDAIERDSGQFRQQRALRTAQKRLQALQQIENEEVQYAGIARSVTQYLGDKFLLAPAGLTRETIHRQLIDRVPGNLVDKLVACLDWADAGRFAPAADGRHPRDLIQEVLILVRQVDNALEYKESRDRLSRNAKP